MSPESPDIGKGGIKKRRNFPPFDFARPNHNHTQGDAAEKSENPTLAKGKRLDCLWVKVLPLWCVSLVRDLFLETLVDPLF